MVPHLSSFKPHLKITTQAHQLSFHKGYLPSLPSPPLRVCPSPVREPSMAMGKGTHVLQLFALRQDPHPALGHPVEVGPVGNHLQHAQVIQLYGGQGEQLTDQRPVKRGWSPAAQGEAHLVTRRGCCEGVRKNKSGFTEASAI